jgi:hypothetical protein
MIGDDWQVNGRRISDYHSQWIGLGLGIILMFFGGTGAEFAHDVMSACSSVSIQSYSVIYFDCRHTPTVPTVKQSVVFLRWPPLPLSSHAHAHLIWACPYWQDEEYHR